MNAEAEKIKKEESLKRTASLSPKKKRGGSQSPTKVPTSPVKKSNVINPFKDFSYSSEKPAHLSKNGGGFGGVPGKPKNGTNLIFRNSITYMYVIWQFEIELTKWDCKKVLDT